MKYELAESILKNTMGHWDLSTMSNETARIQIISEIKYDDYQQFTHGMRFIESLALWMRQFDNNDDKDLAYRFVMDQLIYVSEEEMRQLVSYTYPTIINNYLLQKTREFCETNMILDVKERRQIYDYFRRSSLFLGLSDGAHMDYFRRQNAKLSNEQIFVHYDFSDAKAEDMKNELQQDTQIVNTVKKYPSLTETGFFSSYFLIDDFTGSGRSFIRKDQNGWHGKICKFFRRLKDIGFNCEDIDVHMILYVATDKALNYIREQMDEYKNEQNIKEITIDTMQKVCPIEWDSNSELSKLLKENYEKYCQKGYPTYVDKHFQKGEGKYPYYGFADCSLPLILYHNTPNNSLPILWYTWRETVDALFPRVTRHKER